MATHGTPTHREYISRIKSTPIVESSFPAIKIHVDCISIDTTCVTKIDNLNVDNFRLDSTTLSLLFIL